MKRDDIGIGGWDSLGNIRALGELSDAANAAEEIQRAKADADEDTREIREAINKLAKRGLCEDHVVSILMTLQARIAESGWSHLSRIVSADECLTDAVYHLEGGE